MNYKSYLKDRLKTDKKFAKAYKERDFVFELSNLVTEARLEAGITQEELAKRMKTKQPSIARVENGVTEPSISFLQKVAVATGMELRVLMVKIN